MRHTWQLGWLVLGWALSGGCTNDYGEFAYQPEGANPGPGPGGSNCNNNSDCAGDALCQGGQCSCLGGSACGPGETCCAPQGCRDLDEDSNHCGSCDNACGAGMTCNNGVCSQ